MCKERTCSPYNHAGWATLPYLSVLSGILLRSDDTCQRLDSTATLLGLFQDWDSSIGECNLRPGDILALYTDGITEASDCNDTNSEKNP